MSESGRAYRAAVIGAGKAKDEGFFKGGGHRIGYTHGETYGRNGRTQLVAVADINAENLQAVSSIRTMRAERQRRRGPVPAL